jgi:hypothetical protein
LRELEPPTAKRVVFHRKPPVVFENSYLLQSPIALSEDKHPRPIRCTAKLGSNVWGKVRKVIMG